MKARRILPLLPALMLGASVSAQAASIQISMENLVFAPAEASAKVGDTIEWVNKDVLAHTTTAPKRRLRRDHTAEEDRHPGFEKGRHGRLYCRFHPNMRATLVVSP